MFDMDKQGQLVEAVKGDNCKMIQEILKSGFDISAAENESNYTILMEGCRFGSPKCVKCLISMGADVNRRNKSGKTALHLAVEKGNIECIKLLLDYQNVLVDIQDEFGATSLMLAAHRGFREAVSLLLNRGCNLELRNNFGWTALHYSVVEYDKQLGENKTFCLRELIKSGSDINVKSKAGYAVIHSAIQMGSYVSVKTLLDENCDIDIDAQANPSAQPKPSTPQKIRTLPMTPFFMSLYFGNIPIAELLLNYGCTTTGLWDIPLQLRQNNPFFVTALAPRSLKQICRRTIRKCVGQRISLKVNKLVISEPLKDYILYRNDHDLNSLKV